MTGPMTGRGDAHDLMPAEVLAQIPRLYTQDGNGEAALVHVKWFTPWSNWSWYITEYDPHDRIGFGLAVGHVAELGTVSLAELEEVRGPLGLRVERDLSFPPQTMREVRAYLRRTGGPS
jgi:hypothetical protein